MAEISYIKGRLMAQETRILDRFSYFLVGLILGVVFTVLVFDSFVEQRRVSPVISSYNQPKYAQLRYDARRICTADWERLNSTHPYASPYIGREGKIVDQYAHDALIFEQTYHRAAPEPGEIHECSSP